MSPDQHFDAIMGGIAAVWVIIAALAGLVYRLGRRSARIDDQMGELRSDFTDLKTDMNADLQAVHERLTWLERTRGRGWRAY